MPESPLYEQVTTHSNPLDCQECELPIAVNVPCWKVLANGTHLCDGCHETALLMD